MEHIINYLKSELRTQDVDNNINYKTLKQLKKTPTNTKYVDKTIESITKRNVDGYQVKRVKNKILKMKVKAKFDLCRFILAKAVCLEMAGLDLAQNIY